MSRSMRCGGTGILFKPSQNFPGHVTREDCPGCIDCSEARWVKEAKAAFREIWEWIRLFLILLLVGMAVSVAFRGVLVALSLHEEPEAQPECRDSYETHRRGPEGARGLWPKRVLRCYDGE